MVSDFDFRNLFDTNTGYFRVFYMFFIYPFLFSKNTDDYFLLKTLMFFVQLIHKAGILYQKRAPQKKTMIPFQEQRLDSSTAEKI
jgi:hypothetical protein